MEKTHQAELAKAANGNTPSLKRLIGLVWADCPTAALAKAQRSNDWLERAAIARHPKTPESVLANLALDTQPVVRALAKANLAGKKA